MQKHTKQLRFHSHFKWMCKSEVFFLVHKLPLDFYKGCSAANLCFDSEIVKCDPEND